MTARILDFDVGSLGISIRLICTAQTGRFSPTTTASMNEFGKDDGSVTCPLEIIMLSPEEDSDQLW
jgi:hypothetical protein